MMNIRVLLNVIGALLPEVSQCSGKWKAKDCTPHLPPEGLDISALSLCVFFEPMRAIVASWMGCPHVLVPLSPNIGTKKAKHAAKQVAKFQSVLRD